MNAKFYLEEEYKVGCNKFHINFLGKSEIIGCV